MDLLKIVGLFMLLGIVAVILVAVIHALFRSQLDALLPTLHNWGLSGTLTGILLFSSVFYGLLAFTIYLCIIRKYQLGLAALGFRPAKLSSLALAVAAWPVVVIVGGAATSVVTQLFLGGQFSNPQTRDFAHTGATRGILSLLLLLISLGVVVPIVEETLFRGLLFPLLRRKLPYVAAVPACAIIFAVAHGIPVLIPLLFTAGLALTMLFARTRSLYPGMLLHATQNAVFAVVIWSSFG
jgi:membrane protease YdiL (CAAX protease family)